MKARWARAAFGAVALWGVTLAAGAHAGTIIDEWAAVRAPSPPALETVTVDPKSDALLLLDFNGADAPTSGPCNAASKPRCLASLPRVAALLAAARAKGLFIAYSVSTGGTAGIRAAVAPQPGEPIVKAGPDKFFGTDLRALLAARHVTRLIITGTAAEGAVLDTATDAALHGMDVVVPVDGMSSTDPYAEQYVAWHLTHAPGLAARAMLTSSERLRF